MPVVSAVRGLALPGHLRDPRTLRGTVFEHEILRASLDRQGRQNSQVATRNFPATRPDALIPRVLAIAC